MDKKSNKENKKQLSELELLKLQLATLQADKTALEIQAKNEKERADRLGRELYKERHTIDVFPAFIKLGAEFDIFEGIEKNRTLSYLFQNGFLKYEFELDLIKKFKEFPKDGHKVNTALKSGEIKEDKKRVYNTDGKETRKAQFIRLRAENKSDAEIMNLMGMTEKLFSNYKNTYEKK